MSHFFFLLFWNSEFLYESAVVSLPIRYDSFWYAVHLLSSDVFLINAVFCGYNIAGINRSKLSFTESLWWRLLISGVVYKSAGYNYWSAMSSTNLRCSLQIRGVIYQSAGVNYWSAEKNQMLKTDPKKVLSLKYVFACSSRYNDLTFYEKKIFLDLAILRILWEM